MQYNNKTENGGKAKKWKVLHVQKLVHVCTNKISQIQLFIIDVILLVQDRGAE